MLERLQPVQHQQRTFAANQLGQLRSFIARVFGNLAVKAQPVEGFAEKLIGTGGALRAAALAVEAPVIDSRCSLPTVMCAACIPLEHGGGLALTALTDKGNHVDLVTRRSAPGFVEQMEFLFAADKFF